MAVIDGHFIWVGSCIILQKRLYGRYNKCMNIKGMLISIIVLEIWGITAVKRKKLLKSMIYYTQLSNVAGMFFGFVFTGVWKCRLGHWFTLSFGMHAYDDRSCDNLYSAADVEE